jgi:hypothetical protein
MSDAEKSDILTLHSNGGYAICVSEYSECDQEEAWYYLGTDGKPILDEYGYARGETKYDDRGNAIEYRYYGTAWQDYD